jgi:hypothetical protein
MTTFMFGRWRKKDKHHADRQQGDPHALDREGEPRGGVQSDEYRNAGPTDLVEADGIVMSGPGGAPQEGDSLEARRKRDFGPAAQSSDREPESRS